MVKENRLLPWLPEKAGLYLLQDAASRDRTTARRQVLLEILWQERYLTRGQLIRRGEARLGRGCFGEAAWKDTFSRDMRVVRAALSRSGYTLRYSRTKVQGGYYLAGEKALHPDTCQEIAGAVAEVDAGQIDAFRRLSFAQRFRQGSQISDTARNAWRFSRKGNEHV